MPNTIQSSFTGGMCDSAAAPLPADSYRYAENLDFDGGVLTFRPRSAVVNAAGGSLVNRGVFRHASTAHGDCMIAAYGSSAADNVRFRAWKLNASGSYTGNFSLNFPDLYGHADGYLWGDAGIAIAEPAVFLQVGAAAYVWVTRGDEVLAFRWDGSVAAFVGPLVQLPTVCGAGGAGAEWVPPCRAAAYAYGRVFCAAPSAGSTVCNALAVSAPVADTGCPRLAFDGSQLDIGLDSADDILGLCPAGGGRLIVFKRNSVWLVRGCGGAPRDMLCEVLDPARGCVGPAAFAQVGGAVWYASDDGIRSVDATASPACLVPRSAGIDGFWKARVRWPSGVTPLASAVVFDTRLLFSVPLDGTALSAVLVYSLAHACWVGVWTGFNPGGLVVSQLRSGAGLKMLGADCGLQRLLATRDSVGGAVTARLISRGFDGGAAERVKLYLRAVLALVSNAVRNDGTEQEPVWVNVPAVADFRSVDLELDSSVTHLTGASLFGAVSKLCVLGRVCRELALDVLFKSGIVRLRSLSVQSLPRGR